MTNSILLQDLTQEQLGNLIEEKVKRQLERFKESFLSDKERDQLLTREEACQFLKIDQSTLWAWTKKGKVQAYGIGARRYYKRSELVEALTPLSS